MRTAIAPYRPHPSGSGRLLRRRLLLVGVRRRPARGDDERPKPVLLIPPFENQSKYHENISYEVATGKNPNAPKRRYPVDRYTEAPRSLCEDMLGNLEGVTIAERQRVDTLLVESEFGRLSGLVDSEKAVKLGKMLGANLVVMGTIVDVREETKNFQGYGIKTENTDVLCQIRVRLLDMESGNVKFSKVVKGSKTYSKSSFGGTKSSDRHFAAIEATLEKLGSDSQFRAAILGPKPVGGRGGLRRRVGGSRILARARELRHRDRRQVCGRVSPETAVAGRQGLPGPDQ